MKYLCLGLRGREEAQRPVPERVGRPQGRDPGLRRGPAEQWSLDRHERPAKRPDRRDRAGSKRQAVSNRRPVRRDEGAVGRIFPDRSSGPERSHSGGVEMAVGTPWDYRGAADRGRAQAGQALRVSANRGEVRCVQHA